MTKSFDQNLDTHLFYFEAKALKVEGTLCRREERGESFLRDAVVGVAGRHNCNSLRSAWWGPLWGASRSPE